MSGFLPARAVSVSAEALPAASPAHTCSTSQPPAVPSSSSRRVTMLSRLPQSPRRRYRALRLRGRVVPSQRMNLRNARLWSLLALASAAPHPAEAAWMERTEAIMGTRVYVQLWADDPLKGNAAIDAVMADMRRIDALMSHYKPDSPLSQINAHANSGPVQVDKELFDLIKLHRPAVGVRVDLRDRKSTRLNS